jgi:hypothetical protein
LYGSSPNAEIYYHPNANSLKISVAGGGNSVSILDSSGQSGTSNIAQFINATTAFGGKIYFFNGTNAANATLYNSGSFEQLGRSYFKNNAEITGSLTVSGTAATFSQLGGYKTYPKTITASSLPYTASVGDYIIAVSASAAPGLGIELPSGVDYGTVFIVKDVSGSASTDVLRVTAQNSQIHGLGYYDISIDYGSAQFVYFGPSIGWGVI